MIKYIVEQGMIDSKGNYISYECDKIFDTQAEAYSYCFRNNNLLDENEYHTIWCYDSINELNEFVELFRKKSRDI